MKSKLAALLYLFCLAGFYQGHAGDRKYPVSGIPEDMKKGMYAVIREESTIFNIYGVDKSSETYRIVVTILNKNGERSAKKAVWYDKLRTVDYFRGVVYDADGNTIKKLKQSDIYDRSAVSSGTLFDDSRIKIADLSQTTYPYTVEFEYQVQSKYLFQIPGFDLYNDDEISIQKSSFRLVYPLSTKPRIKLVKIGDPKKETESDNREALSWQFENVKPEKFEKDSPPGTTIPRILVAPSAFSYAGYPGKMDSWENFGKWQIMLNQGRDILPDKTIAIVRELTKNLKTNEEKAKAIYEFVQSKTRYVGIQLGIGGFQPFDAKTVDEVGYGDCKALSNYTVSLLKAVGIKGYYTWIYGGRNPIPVLPDFVDDYFNHIVVSIPNGADTLWLECTSQTNPFGYMGSFTGERKALMITEDGGKLVNTLRYAENINVESRTADVHVEKTGDASAEISTTYSGLQYENGGLYHYLTVPGDEQKKWLEENIGIPSFDVVSFSMTNHKDKIPSAVVKAQLILRRLATVSGKRIFVAPNLMNRSSYVPEKLEQRKTPIVRKTGYVDLDTIRYHLPEELYPEFLPEPVTIKSRFGEYEASFKLDQGSVIYIRKMLVKKGEFPADSYNELIEFYKGVSKHDNTKLVFLNKT